MNGFERNRQSVEALFNSREIKSAKCETHYYDELEPFGFVYDGYYGEGKNFYEIYYYKGNKDLPFRISHYGDPYTYYMSFAGDWELNKKYNLNRLNGISRNEFGNELSNLVKDLDKILSLKSSHRPIKSANYVGRMRGDIYEYIIKALLDIAEWGEKEKGKDSIIEEGFDGIIFRGELFHEYYDFYEGSSFAGEDAFYDMLDDYNKSNPPTKKYDKRLFIVINTDSAKVEIKPNTKLSNSRKPIKSIVIPKKHRKNTKDEYLKISAKNDCRRGRPDKEEEFFVEADYCGYNLTHNDYERYLNYYNEFNGS